MRLNTMLAVSLAGTTQATTINSVTNDALLPFAFTPLPLGSISPSGWLKDQLQLMADGLAGHEHDFYNYVASANWLGLGQTYSDLNEGLPYWFNGLVPLAYGLDDARLKEQVHSVISIVLERRASDGWLGPETGTSRNFWARMPLLLGMCGLAEANSTWEAQLVPAMHKFFALANTMLNDNYTGYWFHEGDVMSSGDFMWGRARYQDMLISLQWLYDNHPGDANQSAILLDNMKLFHDGGYKWEDWYTEANYFGNGIDKDLDTQNPNYTAANYQFEHDVNVGQGLKAVAAVRRFTHDASLVETAMNGVNWTFTYHGAASGTILADERLEGLGPYSGSEFCTAVETTYSMSYLYEALGVNWYADRAELAAFNAIPAMATPDWWARQYLEQPNQPWARNLTDGVPFYDDNSWSTSFGLEPNYPCCTVNHPQGMPKFLSNSYVQVGSNGLAHVHLSPANVNVTINGKQAQVTCDTAYPFMDTLYYIIDTETSFDFYVRVPGWAGSDASLSVNGKTSSLSPDSTSGLNKISVPKGTTKVTYSLPGKVFTTARENDTVAVYRGSVLYALEIENYNSSTLPKPWTNPDYGEQYYNSSYAPPQSRDWQYFNTSAWNYAIDPTTITYHGPAADSSNTALTNPLFAPGAPPGYMTVKACEIDWPVQDSVPYFPPTGDARVCLGDVVEVKFVPYASAKTHMAELPVMDLSSM